MLANSDYVFINSSAIDKYVESVKENDFKPEMSFENTLGGANLDQHVAFVMIFCVLNFSFWGDPKWRIKFDGRFYGGSQTMLKALLRGIYQNKKILKADYLANLPLTDLEKIFQADTPLPMLQERHKLLRLFGKSLLVKYNGSCLNIVKQGNWQAWRIVELLVNGFPGVFNDQVIYKGKTIMFYKRA